MTGLLGNTGTVDVFGIMRLSKHACKHTHTHTNAHKHTHTNHKTSYRELTRSHGGFSRSTLCTSLLFIYFRGEETVCSVPTDWSTGRLINNWISIKKLWVGELGDVAVKDLTCCHGDKSNSDPRGEWYQELCFNSERFQGNQEPSEQHVHHRDLN